MNTKDLKNKIIGYGKSAISIVKPRIIGSMFDAAQKIPESFIGEYIRGQARLGAYKFLFETHRSVINAILWQNALLLSSIMLVYFFQSAIPFYLAYAFVAIYSASIVLRSWPKLRQWFKFRSLFLIVKQTISEEIENELCRLPIYGKKAIEYLGPDLDTLSHDITDELLPDIRAALIHMGLTLVMAFIAFRLTAIPMLEHRALHLG
ncbi:hypothetical protein H8K32_05315 [Undibacterium jejuense]|uniref:Uncharacterized protein n=1 Tax=Undibacterium jejuense TaxID=1344949 RepID=A0A923HFN5_9BURK|nr:hypothetical protein [Undibacterium jejuense]MBC3861513.1 hypothetical protein [Undibacterium jejuense]